MHWASYLQTFLRNIQCTLNLYFILFYFIPSPFTFISPLPSSTSTHSFPLPQSAHVVCVREFFLGFFFSSCFAQLTWSLFIVITVWESFYWWLLSPVYGPYVIISLNVSQLFYWKLDILNDVLWQLWTSHSLLYPRFGIDDLGFYFVCLMTSELKSLHSLLYCRYWSLCLVKYWSR